MLSIQNLPASFRDLYAFGKKMPIDLSLSENPLGCSPAAVSILKNVNQEDVFDYPDPDATALVTLLAERLNVSKESIFLANGSEAIIKLLPQILFNNQDEVIMPVLTFPMFEKSVLLSGSIPVKARMTIDFGIDLADMAKMVTEKTKGIVICNPNNPTGKVLLKNEILSFASSVRVPVIVDEANIEFGGDSVVDSVSSINNLIVLRTFSKGFGLAGLRIGFMVADPEIVMLLKKVSQPFPVSRLAQKAAIEALNDIAFIDQTKKFMKKERQFLSTQLTARGFTVIDSSANNLLVLVKPVFSSSNECVDRLMVEGVSVVNGSSFGLSEVEFIRVSPRLRKTNNQFLKALDSII